VRVAGIDGCRIGWVVATTGIDEGAGVDVAVVGALDEVIAALRDGSLDVVGIDMPIGLPDTVARASDREARRRLGRRGSSVFPTPARAALHATDYAGASAANRAALGVGLSKQSFHLLAKIREVDALVDPALQPRLAEVHPESSFLELAGAPLAHGKKTTEGRAERAALLATTMPGLDRFVAAAGRGVGADDVLDAAVAAWTARRIARGTAVLLGDPDARDARGLRMTIAV
jgi:predicted RNase H-like nuclease